MEQEPQFIPQADQAISRALSSDNGISPLPDFVNENHDYGQLEDSEEESDDMGNDEEDIDEQEVEELKNERQLNVKQVQEQRRTESDWQAREKTTISNIQNSVLKQGNRTVGDVNAIKGYKVYKDFTCMLNLTDVSYGVKGNNKFYQIQVLQRDENFAMFTKWGRIGVKNPRTQIQEVDSRFTAIKEFKKRFAKKTSNDWDRRDEFSAIQGKYTLINVVGGDQSGSMNEEISKLNKRNAFLSQNIQRNQSKLPEQVRQLMACIWDLEHMSKTMRELNIDTDKNPLGRLAGDQITKGYKVLKEIQNHLKSERCKEQTIIDLSNLFYTNIPQSYGMKKVPMIDSMARLREKIILLDILKEFETANKYLNIAISEQNTDVNPLDIFYNLLKCDIRTVTDPELLNMISTSARQTHGPTHTNFKLQVVTVYEIERKLEKLRYSPFQQFTNRKLLWHGSRKSNYVGILSEGLRIAPPEAPSSGYMFGKGLYFADVCSKSAQYCCSTPDNPEGLLLLCEVALGNMYQVYKARDMTQAPHRFHSVHGVGRNCCDPSKQVKLKNDSTIELGQVIPNEELRSRNVDSDLIYNEYIVYDTAQVLIKYIIKVKFTKESNAI